MEENNRFLTYRKNIATSVDTHEAGFLILWPQRRGRDVSHTDGLLLETTW